MGINPKIAIEIDGVKRINERFIVRDGKTRGLLSNVNNYTVNGISYFLSRMSNEAIRGKPSFSPFRANTIRSDAFDIPFFLHPSDGWNGWKRTV